MPPYMPSQPKGLSPSILNRIYPAIKDLGSSDLDKAIRANVSLTAKTLPRYSHTIRGKGIPIVGAYYSLQTGRVTKV